MSGRASNAADRSWRQAWACVVGPGVRGFSYVFLPTAVLRPDGTITSIARIRSAPDHGMVLNHAPEAERAGGLDFLSIVAPQRPGSRHGTDQIYDRKC